MKFGSLRFSLALTTALVLSLVAAPIAAQDATDDYRYDQVISLNPFGILLEFFNAEYERVVSPSSTAGIGGSYWSPETTNYLNADAFYRFYVGPEPLEGWAFGVKAGITSIDDQGTFFGVGFDANRSWMLGERENFYVGLGFGLKRLFGASDDDLPIIPTIRIVNVGIAF